ncbi:MAG: DUF1127 domain-containing protein [Gammaproteobacteria bacterium]|nr:DUF1127 domain-containing protein [Gammaproteobacteria bacterium]
MNELRQTTKLLNFGSELRRSFMLGLNWLNQRWECWSINFETRKQLLELEEHELKDIGLSREDAIREGRKIFWRC